MSRQFDLNVDMLKRVNGSACVIGLEQKRMDVCPFAVGGEMEGKPRPDYRKPVKGVIHVDVHNNPIARIPFETDPHKHFMSRTGSDFKTYKPAKIRAANKVYRTTATAQQKFINEMSVPRATTAPTSSDKMISQKSNQYSFLTAGKDLSRYQYLEGKKNTIMRPVSSDAPRPSFR